MDLYTFRHLTTDLLVYHDIRLPGWGLRVFEDLLHVRSKVRDSCVIGVRKFDSISTPHCRNIVSVFQSSITMGHDAVKLILQRHVSVGAAHPCGIS